MHDTCKFIPFVVRSFHLKLTLFLIVCFTITVTNVVLSLDIYFSFASKLFESLIKFDKFNLDTQLKHHFF